MLRGSRRRSRPPRRGRTGCSISLGSGLGRLRVRSGPGKGEMIAAAMVEAYRSLGRVPFRPRDSGSTYRGRGRPASGDHVSAVGRTASAQVCGRCKGEQAEAFSRSALPGLRRLVRSWRIRRLGSAAQSFRLPCGAAVLRTGLDASGVWRYRELVLPAVTEASAVVSRPEETRRSSRAPRVPLTGVADLLDEARRPQPDRLAQGLGHDGRHHVRPAGRGCAAAACASTGNQHVGLAGGVCALAGILRARVRPFRARGRGQVSPRRHVRRAHAHRPRRFRRVHDAAREAMRSLASISSTP